MSAQSSPTSDTPKILIVDDRKENIIATKAILKKLDAEIYEAQSGMDALTLVLRHEFAVILLDVQMPGMDGFETAEHIRENDESRHVPIIFVTALSKEERYVNLGYESGAVDYLFKPVNPHILQSKVVIFLDLYRQKTALRALNVDLEHAKADLEQSNRELEDFAHVASHDLKEPLNSILMLKDMLLRFHLEHMDEEGREYLTMIGQTAERMRALITNILEYSEIKNKEIAFERVDLQREVEAVRTDLHVRIEKANGTVVIEDLPVIDAHAGMMRQALQNLIGNAIKYSREGVAPVVRISAHANSGENTCELRIQDNGIGFDEKYKDRIFTPFKRLVGKSEFEGSGIGLATVVRIIQKHQGAIDVTSVPGEGSTFIVRLPLRQSTTAFDNIPDPTSGSA